MQNSRFSQALYANGYAQELSFLSTLAGIEEWVFQNGRSLLRNTSVLVL